MKNISSVLLGGDISTTVGGIVSFGPPVGLLGLAHLDNTTTLQIVNTTLEMFFISLRYK
jgi:hypothetical protein